MTADRPRRLHGIPSATGSIYDYCSWRWVAAKGAIIFSMYRRPGRPCIRSIVGHVLTPKREGELYITGIYSIIIDMFDKIERIRFI